VVTDGFYEGKKLDPKGKEKQPYAIAALRRRCPLALARRRAASESFINVKLRGIVGFRFVVTRLEGKWKMSQNRAPKDRQGVVSGLALRDRGDDQQIAELVVSQHTKLSHADS
jgi:transcriptional regulator